VPFAHWGNTPVKTGVKPLFAVARASISSSVRDRITIFIQVNDKRGHSWLTLNNGYSAGIVKQRIGLPYLGIEVTGFKVGDIWHNQNTGHTNNG
jgi:hypothetical protein